MGLSAFDKLFSKNVPHITERIFLSLDYESYKNCLEVSEYWKKHLISELYQRNGKYVFKDEIATDQLKLWMAAKEGNVGDV